MRDQVLAECKQVMEEKLEQLAQKKDKEIQEAGDNLHREQQKWNHAKDQYISEIAKLNDEIEELNAWWNEDVPEGWEDWRGDEDDENANEHDMAADDSFDAGSQDGNDLEEQYGNLGADDDTKQAIKSLQDNCRHW